MWKRIGLKSEPFFSIEPLSSKEDFAYFVNRDKEIAEISSYLEGAHPFNLLITGKAGIGKTTLINRVLLDFPVRQYPIYRDSVSELADGRRGGRVWREIYINLWFISFYLTNSFTICNIYLSYG